MDICLNGISRALVFYAYGTMEGAARRQGNVSGSTALILANFFFGNLGVQAGFWTYLLAVVVAVVGSVGMGVISGEKMAASDGTDA